MMSMSLDGIAPTRAGPAAEGAAGMAALVVDLAWMNGHTGAWDDLVRRSAQPNPFFSRHVVTAHAAGHMTGGMRWLLARREGRWVAALPHVPRGARVGWLRVHAAWRSPYTPSSRPLVEAEQLGANVAALLDAMAAEGTPWLLPDFTLDDPLGVELLREATARGWSTACLDRYRRPIFRRRSEAAPGRETSGTRLRKDLARRRRRLGEAGAVAVETVTEPGGAFDAAFGRFLALEAAGWKGRKGTALASHARTRALTEALRAGRDEPVSLRVDELTLDGVSIAASVSFVCGEVAYLWKAAYAEGEARFSPGNLLEAEIVAAMHRTGFAACLNSVARPGTPLDALFPDREQVADLVVDPRPAHRSLAFGGAVALERCRRAALARLKGWRRRMAKGAS